MPSADASLQSWLLGLLASGVVVVVGLYFRGILTELRSVAADLRELVKNVHVQDKELALTVQRVDAHDVELKSLRDRQHDLAAMLQGPVLQAGRAK